VVFGAVPDFEFGGPGVRLSDVTAGSPAEKAGLRAGDVIRRIGTATVDSLQEFSAILRGLQPGQTVAVSYEREGAGSTAAVTVVAR
jgi:putative serine protease PepD